MFVMVLYLIVYYTHAQLRIVSMFITMHDAMLLLVPLNTVFAPNLTPYFHLN
jgi:hypothetical protein